MFMPQVVVVIAFRNAITCNPFLRKLRRLSEDVEEEEEGSFKTGHCGAAAADDDHGVLFSCTVGEYLPLIFGSSTLTLGQ